MLSHDERRQEISDVKAFDTRSNTATCRSRIPIRSMMKRETSTARQHKNDPKAHGSRSNTTWLRVSLGGRKLAIALLVLCTFSEMIGAAAAEDTPYFKGKQIRLVIGSSAGGGYDLFARTIATYWPRH